MMYAVILLATTSLVLALMYRMACVEAHKQTVIAAYAQKFARDLRQELAKERQALERACTMAVDDGHQIADLIVARDDAVDALNDFKRRNPNWN